MTKCRVGEDEMIARMKVLIGNLESRVEAIERGRLNAFDIDDLAKRVEAVWAVLERRAKERPHGHE
jgi:hypothetical protein